MMSELDDSLDSNFNKKEKAHNPYIVVPVEVVWEAVITEPDDLQKFFQLAVAALPSEEDQLNVKLLFYKHLVTFVSAVGYGGICMIPNPMEKDLADPTWAIAEKYLSIFEYLFPNEAAPILKFIDSMDFPEKVLAKIIFGNLWKYLIESEFFEAKLKIQEFYKPIAS